MARIEARKNKNGVITSYRIRVSLGYDEEGNKIFEDTTYHPEAKTPARARKEVEQYAVQFEKAVKEGTAFTSGDKITFSEFVEFWDENSLRQKVLTGTLTQKGREGYVKSLNRHVVPHIGHMKLNQVKAPHIDKIVVGLIDQGKAPKTVRAIFNTLRSCYDYAFRKNFVKENPCARCEPLPKIERKKELHCFNEDQVKRFLNEALTGDYAFTVGGHKRKYTAYDGGTGEEFDVHEYNSHRSVPLQFRVFFTLAVYGGFRRGELIALNWEDVDPERQTITIKKSMSYSSKGSFLKKPKTDAGIRTIILPKVCFLLLDEWKREQMQLCFKLGTAWEGYRGKDYDKNPVFIQSDSGCRMYLSTPTAKFKQIVTAYNKTVPEEAMLPMIRLHDLRHTNASHLVASGVDIETVAKRLGHSKPSFTLDVYGHALEENDEKASDKLEEIFDKAQ